MPDHIDAIATGVPLFPGTILICARQPLLSHYAHDMSSFESVYGTVEMQSAIADMLLLAVTATSAAASLVSATLSGQRRTHRTDFASVARSACECTRGDCSMCPARWSL